MRALMAVLVLLASLAAVPAHAFETTARAAILIDYRSGAVLFEKSPDQPLPPASLSKLMTAYLVFEKLKAGDLKLADMVPVSERAWRTGGSRMFLQVNTRASVDDLIHGIIIESGNDACVAVAEALAGSAEAFVDRMNAKAAELGLKRSHFKNPTGLPDPEHLMSVRDLATLARAIIQRFPEYYPIYSQHEFTYGGIKQQNRNPLLQANVPGVDGMKTGFTDEADYGLVASAQRNGQRLILVIAGVDTPKQRRLEGERLLEYGFREFQQYKLFHADESIQEAGVWLGQDKKVPLVAQEDVAVTLSRDARAGMVVKLRYDSPVPAPITQGQRLGEIEITAPGQEPVTVPLVAARAVDRAGMIGRVTGALSYLIWGAS